MQQLLARFSGANRKAKTNVAAVHKELRATVGIGVPATKEKALLGSFTNAGAGKVDV